MFVVLTQQYECYGRELAYFYSRIVRKECICKNTATEKTYFLSSINIHPVDIIRKLNVYMEYFQD
jgi:hypothetical protein